MIGSDSRTVYPTLQRCQYMAAVMTTTPFKQMLNFFTSLPRIILRLYNSQRSPSHLTFNGDKLMPIRSAVALSLILSLVCLPVLAQDGNPDMLARIRKEAMERSQIMKTMHMLTDVYGPRLTGSPNNKAAAEWAVKTLS